MHSPSHIRTLAFCLALMGVAPPALAQSSPRVELSGGYQFVNFSLNGDSESMSKGWYADVTGNLTSMFGVVFQVGGNYKTFEESLTFGGITATATADLDVHQFLGGIRLHVRSNEESATNIGVAVGGGANFGVSGSLAVRVAADYLRVFVDDGGANVFRFQAGVVIGR
jgi:hypothetical protein